MPDRDLSSGGNAKMLTKPGEPYAVPDQDFPDGMLGLFATKFLAHYDDEGLVTEEFDDFLEARKTNSLGWQPRQIDRIETVWVHKDRTKDVD
jgi:hypothetical protein